MKLINIGKTEWLVEVENAPHESRVFRSKYAALLYMRKLENEAKLNDLLVMGIGS